MEVDRQLLMRNSTFMDSKMPKTAEEYFSLRESFAVELRKKKRRDQAMFKRKKVIPVSYGSPANAESILTSLNLQNLSSIKALRQYLCSPELDFGLICKVNPEIVQELATGLSSSKTELVLEICWCLTNLALGPPGLINDIAKLVPTVSRFVIHVGSKMVAEQACWLLGNLAAESKKQRDEIKQVCGLLQAICNLFRFNTPSLSSVACWTLCNLIRNQVPDSSIFVEAGAVTPILEYIHRPETTALCADSLWFLSYLTVNTGQEVVQSVLEERHMTRLISLLSSSTETSILVPVLRILGNLLTYGSNSAAIMRFDRLRDAILEIVNKDGLEVQLEAIWLVANAIGKSHLYANWLLQTPVSILMLRTLVKLMEPDKENELRIESGIAIYNIAETSRSAYIQTLLEIGGTQLIDAYCKNLGDMPFWFALQVQGISDIDLLLCSIGFMHLALEFALASKKNAGPEKVSLAVKDKLYCQETFEAIEGFAMHYLGVTFRPDQPERFIQELCADVLKRFYSEFTEEEFKFS